MSTGVITRDHDLRRVPADLLDALRLRAGVHAPVATYRPVVAVTLTRGRDQVLVVVRDPEENRTHPGVVSSPTRRIHGRDLEIAALAAELAAGENDVPGWLLAEVGSLLVDKVGIAAEATRGLRGTHVQVWQAESVIALEGSEVVAEPLTMLNVHVALPEEVEVPVRTRSHSQQRFVSRQAHHAAFARRDATGIVDPDALGVPPVVYGLCTQSTTAMLELVESARAR